MPCPLGSITGCIRGRCASSHPDDDLVDELPRAAELSMDDRVDHRAPEFLERASVRFTTGHRYAPRMRPISHDSRCGGCARWGESGIQRLRDSAPLRLCAVSAKRCVTVSHHWGASGRWSTAIIGYRRGPAGPTAALEQAELLTRNTVHKHGYRGSARLRTSPGDRTSHLRDRRSPQRLPEGLLQHVPGAPRANSSGTRSGWYRRTNAAPEAWPRNDPTASSGHRLNPRR